MDRIKAFYLGLKRPQQLALLAALPIVVIIGGSWWASTELAKLGRTGRLPAFLERAGDASSLGAQIEVKKSEIAATEAVVAAGKNVDKQLKSLQLQIAELERQLPNESQEPAERGRMPSVLAIYANEAKIRIKALKEPAPNVAGKLGAKKGAAKGGLETRDLVWEIEFEGDQDGIIDFIDRIEKNERFFAVRDLQIRSGKIGTNGETKQLEREFHTVKMSIVTYVVVAADNKGGK